MKHRIKLGTKVAMLFLFLFNIGLIQAQDPGWEVNPANFAFNGEVTAQVIIGTVAVESGTLAAFYGEECRGVIDATFFPPTGENVFTVMCFSNDASGETLTFKYYDPDADQVYDITETIEFVSDMVEGSAMVPLLYNAYIASTDATLSDLQVDGTTVSGFSADIFSYDVELAYATTIVPTVTAATTDANASLVVTDATALPGTTEVVVTAGDGVTNLTYSVNFTLAANTDATLSDLLVDGTTVSGFSADIFSYSVELPNGTIIVPAVTATTTDANASMVVIDAIALPGTTDVVVTADDGVTSLTYSVNFTLEAAGPTVAAPMPTQEAVDVVSIYSDTYTDLEGTNFNPSWGQTTVVTNEDIDGNEMMKYANFNYQGTELSGSQDLSLMEFMHVDIWTADATVIKVSPISGTGEFLVSLEPLNQGSWNTYDIPVTDFTGVSMDDIYQLKFDGQDGVNPSNIYVDNIYFYKSPTPPGSDATLSDLQVDGSTVSEFSANILSYTVELPNGTAIVPAVTATTTDVNASFVVTDATVLPGTTDVVVTAEDGATILTYSVNFTLAAAVPTVAAPMPTQDAADVVSIFSDTYTDLEGTDFNPGWGQTTVVTFEDIDGNEMMKYANFNYQGTELAGSQDLSSMEFMHVDIWTDDATVIKVTPISGTGEWLVSLEPINLEGWNSYDIPVTDFEGVSMDDIYQLKFDGQDGVNPSNIYVDNIYFYKSPTVVLDPPTDFMVTEDGYGTWVAPTGDAIGYNLYLDGIMSGTTTDLFYQYLDLTAGQTYMGGVSALYGEGESVIVDYEFTVPVVVVLDPPTDFMVTEDGYGTWVAPNNPEWTVNPANFAYNGEVTVQVLIETVAVESGTLAAFYGEECRGVIDATQFPVTGEYIFTVMCFSNDASGETLTFMYYDPVENQVYNITEDVDFVADMIQGTPDAPLMFNAIAGTTLDPIGYNLYLDGIMSGTTTDLFYQYLDLTAGQTYMGGVSALYGEGESVIVDYEFTVAAVVLDPPTDFMVTEDGYGTWVAPTGDAIGYNLYLDGLVVDNTEDLFYQYADLTAGETYMGGVSALYAEGESVIVDYEFTVQDGGCEGFDALTVGGYVAEQLGGMWTTWSGTPGSAEDAIVSDMYSVSPSNSILVEGTTDLVLMFAEENLTTGSYTFRNDIFIPTGTTGYWNLQKDVVIGEEWGFQVMYEDDMTMIVDAGAAAAAVLPYSYDTWYHNEVIVDLDNDWCEFFVDGNLIIGYQWTLGTFGDPGANTLGSSNFYANPGALGTPPGAHFDDVCFSSGGSITLVPPTDFMVTEEGYGTWVAPAGDPIVYNLYLDEVMVGTTTDLFYQYLDITAGQTYMGGVAAVYEGGESIIVEYEFSVPAVDPPTDFMVTEEGYGTWVAPTGDAIGYNLYLDGLVVDNTEDLFYQYADLTAGETYMGGVSALYAEGESVIVDYEFTVQDGGCEGFDALTVGGYVAEQLGGMWTTWSGTPGSAEDAIVSDMYSVSPSNSILVEGTTDLVLMFAEENLTTGSYTFRNDIFIPTGTTGYWNLQKDVVIGEEWGFQVMYEDDMTMIVDAGAAAAAVLPYSYDTWYHNEVIVDLDNDWCEFFVDGNLIIGYQWTLGTFGDPGANTLGSSNFYANPGALGTPPGAHFDDVCFSSGGSITLVPPTDFMVTEEGYGTWVAPAGDPIVYNLYLDEVMVGTTTDLFYQYLDITAGQTYMGGVAAVYEGGESIIVEYEFSVPAVDPPTDFMVTEEGYGTWVAPAGDPIVYNLYLDEVMVGTTSDLFYQYADLTAGETYMGGVSAVYDEGESDIVEYEFTVPDGGSCENFDALIVGGYVAEQLGGMWTTWSGTPGTAEDAIVSDLYSVSPANSILVEGTTDLVLMFADENLTTGSHTFTNDIFIPTGTTGYWNLQKDLIIGVEWGFQIMYEDDMTMIVDAGAAAAAVIPYTYDTWYHNEVVVDLDNDWCDFYIDGELIIGYQWTLGTFGTPGANTLGSCNFFANPGAGGTPPGAHFDDVCFSGDEPVTYDPPTDLFVDNSGYATWLSPGSFNPEWIGYSTGEITNSIGTDAAADFDVAVRFTAADLAGFEDGAITKLNFVPGEDDAMCTYTLKVWVGAGEPTLVYSQELPTIVADQWNEIVLDTPVPFDNTEELWFGFNVNTTGGYPAGCDDGPQVEGFGNMMYWQGAWTTLTGLAPTLTFNWAVEGYVEVAGVEAKLAPIAQTTPSVIANVGTLSTRSEKMAPAAILSPEASRALMGYNVFLDGEYVDYTTDLFWQYEDLVDEHTYTAGVSAVYDNGESVVVDYEFMFGYVGVSEILENTISIFPNPATDNVNIQSEFNITDIYVYDYVGKVIYTIKDSNTKNVVLNTNSYGSGIYIVRIQTENGVVSTKRVIITK